MTDQVAGRRRRGAAPLVVGMVAVVSDVFSVTPFGGCDRSFDRADVAKWKETTRHILDGDGVHVVYTAMFTVDN